MLPIALAAGVICAGVVVAYFIALDQLRAAAANGAAVAGAPRQTFVKQLESFMRPIARLPARSAIQLRQKLSQAGNPGSLTPAGFHALRLSFAALFAIVGLGIGMLGPLGIPVVIAAPLTGATLALFWYFLPVLWLEQRIGQRRRQIQRSLA